MSKYRVEISEEALKAFDEEFEIQGLSESAKVTITAVSLPLFALGYVAAQDAAGRGAKQCLERLEARAKLAQDLSYPAQWDTAAYPNVESAAIEAIHTANIAAEAFSNEIKKSTPKDAGEKLYTMDQMRDYAAGVFTTRSYVILNDLETKIVELKQKAANMSASGKSYASSCFLLVASELRTIADNAKQIGAQSFQRRAFHWAKKCFGLFQATSIQERNERFAEEALELVQACGMTKRAAMAAVEYVYNRPIGDKKQEVGGTYTTLALLCAANGIDMVGAGEKDLLEIDNPETTERIREKRKTKPDFF